MERPLQAASADIMYHVLNCADARRTLFDDDGDIAAFGRVLTQACERVPMRLLARIIHDASATSADPRLRRAVSPFSPSTYCWGLASFILTPVPV